MEPIATAPAEVDLEVSVYAKGEYHVGVSLPTRFQAGAT